MFTVNCIKKTKMRNKEAENGPFQKCFFTLNVPSILTKSFVTFVHIISPILSFFESPISKRLAVNIINTGGQGTVLTPLSVVFKMNLLPTRSHLIRPFLAEIRTHKLERFSDFSAIHFLVWILRH